MKHYRLILRGTLVVLASLTLLAPLGGCGTSTSTPAYRNELNTMQKNRLSIKGHSFDVWLALTPAEQEKGLMQVGAEELAPLPDGSERGMLFVFPDERPLAFWMYNTITPLDIAYINAEGRIVSTHTMAPLETRLYPSAEPARFALEVRAGVFETLRIAPGDRVELPDSVLKSVR